jgi:nickel-dependent lactate racemase
VTVQIALRQNLWGGDYAVELNLPETWRTTVVRMAGDEKLLLSPVEYREAVSRLEAYLRGKKEICVLFDDLSRPTKTFAIVPYLLEVFEYCGIRDEQVRFLCALGTHGAHDNRAFRRKLGPEVLERFPVYNHNPYENCEFLGKTSLGTPVMVNREFLSCDGRIGISAFTPHMFCGFGGGAKIVMPGISHIDAMKHHHGTLLQNHREDVYGIGRYGGNPLLDDLRESARIAGLGAKIDVLVNSGGDATDIFAGDLEELYPYMLEKAPAHYSAKAPYKANIVIANAYGKANESSIALSLSESLLKDEGGDVVVLCDIEEGQVVHYLLGRFGTDTWGHLAFGERIKDSRMRRLFVYSRHKDLAGSFWFGKKEEILWFNNLSDLIDVLAKDYRGRNADVLVIPDATIQIVTPA